MSPSPPDSADPEAPAPVRRRVDVRGAVQGVGFRPHVYRLARDLGLDGLVRNVSFGVTLEVEGLAEVVDVFLQRLRQEAPQVARIESLRAEELPASGEAGFRIEPSEEAGPKEVAVLPDLATCPECLAEILDADERRHGYPFTNCTSCGPRFSIIEALPYDRPHTTMRSFAMCGECRGEYENPLDRRFHAQPIACPACGPRLRLVEAAGGDLLAREGGAVSAGSAAVMAAAARLLAAGRIVAVQALGGYQLLVDATDEAAVQRLRARKGRPHKPLAVMVHDLDAARAVAEISEAAAAALQQRQAPIVILPRRADAGLVDGVAPGQRTVGLMLPSTPLHHLLVGAVAFPVVATSGNLSGEPICIDPEEAHERLGAVADAFLDHDRPIARHVDDSVLLAVDEDVHMLRRARGWAPEPIDLGGDGPGVLAVGGHLKNTVGVAVGRRAVLSQHLGDMHAPRSQAAFGRVIDDLLRLYEAEPTLVVHDMHPDYVSTRWATAATEAGVAGAPAAPPAGSPPPILRGASTVAVQHHHAHLASCLVDNGRDEVALGVVWDGTGYGDDGTVWGGEFLLGDARGYRRVAHLRPFRLPGAEQAVLEPRRVALALLWEIEGRQALERRDRPPLTAWDTVELETLARMLEGGVNTPLTTSAGRLFDGVAALAGLFPRITFEGQAAMALEQAAGEAGEAAARTTEATGVTTEAPGVTTEAPGVTTETPGVTTETPGVTTEAADRYRLELRTPADPEKPLVLDWEPVVRAVVGDCERGTNLGILAARFHDALADAIVRVAEHVGQSTVVLTGGCFQNARLVATSRRLLRNAGFEVLTHRSVPANDGGLALGQLAVARAIAADP